MNIKKLFYLRELDSHLIVHFFGLRLMLKHGCLFNYKPAIQYGLNYEQRDTKLIVSLTTFPNRIKTVNKTINTLLQQTVKPDLLVLWLAREQFPNGENDLPQELLKLKELGLIIDWCEDLKSYKKLIPSLRKYPNDIIVTADDDLYYEKDWLESLYNAYLANPNNIYARRATRIKPLENTFEVLSNRKHLYTNYFEPSYENQLLGGSGCLFPPNSLYKDILDTDKIMSLMPTQDDFYFWAMAVLNHKKVGVVKGFNAHLYCVEGTQDCGLCKINKSNKGGLSGNEACEKLNQAYPEILNIIKGA